jgi:TatD DNase family protein
MSTSPPEVIDTHCHLTSPDLYAQRDHVIAEASRAGVTRIITVACRAEECERALALHESNPSVLVSAGIHPHESARVDREELMRVAASWRRPGIVAVGEMGLDYHYDFSPRDVQQRVFNEQLDLAAALDLPVVIHCREAHDQTIATLEKHGYRGRRVVFHCFSGTAAEAADIRQRGWRTSFTGLITFKNAAGPQQAMVDTPLDQLMFETDAPYLSPEPVRKMRPNEPHNVVHTIRFAALLRGMPFEQMAALSTANASAFFGISA